MPGSARNEGAWGRGAVSPEQVEAFARRIDVTPTERTVITRTLLEFPEDVQVRGMFFDGVVKAVRAHYGAEVCARLVAEAEIPRSTLSFSLYPHRDFYKLFFYAAPVLHHGKPLADGMQRIAETFYPMFRESMVGRTMALLMGTEPSSILTRLAEAYSLSVQGNRHTFEPTGPRSGTWRALVEPTPVYPSIFRGIVIGTMRSHDVPVPMVTPRGSTPQGNKTCWVIDLSW